MSILELKDISKEYKTGRDTLKVLSGINESLEAGEFVALVGASGAGKSTLMHIIGGLDTPTSGSVFFEGAEISKLKGAELDKYRGRSLGFVFQSHYLLDDFTALENVILPKLILDNDKPAAEMRARELLELVGLTDRLNHYPSELSGGEQQRVALARAVVNNPKLLLADEPTGNLDKANSLAVMGLLGKLAKSGVAVIIVTHDDELASFCDRRIRLEKI